MSTVTNAVGSALDKNTFLNLLVTQLENQDPTAPMSNEQFINVLAQFSTLEEAQSTNEMMSTLNDNTTQMRAESLIGKSVVWKDSKGNSVYDTVLEVGKGSDGTMNLVTKSGTVAMSAVTATF